MINEKQNIQQKRGKSLSKKYAVICRQLQRLRDGPCRRLKELQKLLLKVVGTKIFSSPLNFSDDKINLSG